VEEGWDDLRDSFAARRLEARADADTLALEVELSAPLSRERLEALLAEGRATAEPLPPGLLGPHAVEAARDRVTLLLDPVDPATVSLQMLLEALADEGSPLGPSAAASVVGTLASVLFALHALSGPTGQARLHRGLHPSAILLGPGGAIGLLGSGLSAVDAFLLPAPRDGAGRLRYLSPEAARGEPEDARSDVYALGVLYYELLTGRSYREGKSRAALLALGLDGAPPDLPGALPDPRPSLIALLERALAPDREARPRTALELGEAVVAEAAAAGVPLGDARMLERLVLEFVPADAPRGPAALLAASSAPTGWEAVLGGPEEPPPAEPAPRSSPPRPPSAAARLVPASGALSAAASVPRTGPTSSSLPMGPVSSRSAARPTSRGPSSRGPTSRGPTTRRSGTAPVPTASRRGSWATLMFGVTVALGVAVLARGRSRPAAPEEASPVTGLARGTATATRASGIRLGSDPSRKPVGLLTVISQPSGATVELDGERIGITPLVVRRTFDRDYHEVRVTAAGYQPWQRTVVPDTSRSGISLSAELEAIP
jgi:hypothetical protein